MQGILLTLQLLMIFLTSYGRLGMLPGKTTEKDHYKHGGIYNKDQYVGLSLLKLLAFHFMQLQCCCYS